MRSKNLIYYRRVFLKGEKKLKLKNKKIYLKYKINRKYL